MKVKFEINSDTYYTSEVFPSLDKFIQWANNETGKNYAFHAISARLKEKTKIYLGNDATLEIVK